jgi:hypothetical protein
MTSEGYPGLKESISNASTETPPSGGVSVLRSASAIRSVEDQIQQHQDDCGNAKQPAEEILTHDALLHVLFDDDFRISLPTRQRPYANAHLIMIRLNVPLEA